MKILHRKSPTEVHDPPNSIRCGTAPMSAADDQGQKLNFSIAAKRIHLLSQKLAVLNGRHAGGQGLKEQMRLKR